MGNSRFKFSDMMPNAWLHKLKDMAKNKKNQTQKSKQLPQHCKPRKSYHFTRDLDPVDGFYVQTDPPRKSSRKRYYSRRRNSRSSTACSCRETVWSKADSPLDYSASSSSLSSSDDGSPSESSDVDAEKIDELPELQLPPAKFDGMKTKRNNRDKNMSPVRKFSVGVKLRAHSPRIRSMRLIHGRARKSVSSTSSSSSSRLNALAVVKTSFDPELDFSESMVEMIVENNIRTSPELEELLACYLSLNSDEYHQVIIKVFKQIWFDLNRVHFNY